MLRPKLIAEAFSKKYRNIARQHLKLKDYDWDDPWDYYIYLPDSVLAAEVEEPEAIVCVSNTLLTWLLKQPIYRYKKGSSLEEALLNTSLEDIPSENYVNLPSSAVYVEIDGEFTGVGYVEGCFVRSDEGILCLCADVAGDELIQVEFDLKSGNALKGLSKALKSTSRLKLSLKKETLAKVNPAKPQPSNVLRPLFKTCLQLLSDVCSEPVNVEKKPPARRITVDRPKRTNKPQPKELKTYPKGYKTAGNVVKRKVSYNYSSSYKGTGQGRPKNAHYRNGGSRWQPTGPRKDEKGNKIDPVWKRVSVRDSFINGGGKQGVVPTIFNRK